MSQTRIKTINQKISELEKGNFIYLHPSKNVDKIAYFGIYNKTKEVEEFEGDHLEFDSKIFFKFNLGYGFWEPKLDSRKIIIPVDDILDGNYFLNGVEELDILKTMERHNNPNGGLVSRVIQTFS